MLALILALVVSEPTEFPGVTCGERCIYGTLGSLSQDVTLKEVQDEYSGRSLGSYCSLADLAVILDYFGVHSAPVSVPDKDIGLVPVGSILHLNGAAEHFVIYGGTENGNIVLLDLPLPATMVSEVDFFSQWSGNALFVARDKAKLEAVVATLDRNSRIERLLCWLPLMMCFLCLVRHYVLACLGLLALCFYIGCDSPKDEGLQSGGLQVAMNCTTDGSMRVPPEGRIVTVSLENKNAEAIQILNIRKSCACAEIDLPNSIEPNSQAYGKVKLKGTSEAVARSVSISLETSVGETNLSFRFFSGPCPQVSPRFVRLDDHDGVLCGVASLWVETNSVKRVELLDAESFRFIPGERYKINAEGSVAYPDDFGVCCFRFETRFQSESKSSKLNGVPISLDGGERLVAATFVANPRNRLRVDPPHLTFLDGERDGPKSFIVSASADFDLELRTDKDLLRVTSNRLSQRCWRISVLPTEGLDFSSVRKCDLFVKAQFRSGVTDEILTHCRFRSVESTER